jgi:hypothetical protein
VSLYTMLTNLILALGSIQQISETQLTPYFSDAKNRAYLQTYPIE